MTIKGIVVDVIARSKFLACETFKRKEGIHDACTACKATVTGLKSTLMCAGVQKSPTTRQYTNATQIDLRSQMFHPRRRRKSFAINRADTSSANSDTSINIQRLFTKHFVNEN